MSKPLIRYLNNITDDAVIGTAERVATALDGIGGSIHAAAYHDSLSGDTVEFEIDVENIGTHATYDPLRGFSSTKPSESWSLQITVDRTGIAYLRWAPLPVRGGWPLSWTYDALTVEQAVMLLRLDLAAVGHD